jgi:hypothetical protein
MDKQRERREGLKTYESILRAVRKWQREHRDKHNENQRAYYNRNKEILNEKSKSRYYYRKAIKELGAIEIF